MLTRQMVAAFYDELEKISTLLPSPASVKSLVAKAKGLPSPASLVRQTALAKKVRIAKDAPARIIGRNEPKMISRRALRPTMAVPALRPATQVPALKAVA